MYTGTFIYAWMSPISPQLPISLPNGLVLTQFGWLSGLFVGLGVALL